MKITIIFASILCLLSCKVKKNCTEQIKPDCACIQIYEPVCGCNNKTYSNSCMAECAGIKSYKKGECPNQNKSVQLEGRKWQLVQFANVSEPMSVPDNIQINITFEGSKANGKGGCNQYGANFKADNNSLKVENILSTKMYCQNASKLEMMFFKMLKESQSFSFKGDNLEINCGDMGNLVFR